MSYSVKEIFYSLQGEGFHAGRPAIFCRFAGCNLWSGREQDREKSVCTFCDTDFVGCDGEGGGKYKTANELVNKILDYWPKRENAIKSVAPFVILTGGEPALQVDSNLISEFKNRGFDIAIETNGTLELPGGIDWVCLSPKGLSDIKLKSANELKFVYPQKDLSPHQFENFSTQHFYIQPLESEGLEKNISDSIKFCLENPTWHLSTQMHKIVGIE